MPVDFRPNSGGSGLPAPGDDGSLLCVKDGAWDNGTAADLKAASAEFTGEVSASSMDADAVTVENVGQTQGVYTDETGIQLTDTEAGESLFLHSGTSIPPVQALTPGGKLTVPPCHIQTTGDNAVQLNAAADWVSLIFSSDVDEILSSLSVYLKTIAATGNMSFGLYDTVKGVIADGTTNPNMTSCIPVAMTGATTPAPYAISVVDVDGNAVGNVTTYYAWKLLNKSIAGGGEFVASSAPTALAPFNICYSLDKARVINKIIHWGNSSGSQPKNFTIWGATADVMPAGHLDDGWTLLSTKTGIADTAANLYTELGFTNGTAYKHYRERVTDRNGVAAEMRLGEVSLVEAEIQYVPNTQLADLGTLDVGSSNGVWLRHTFDNQQLQRNKVYAVIGKGADTKDFSVSTRRVNTTAGSSLPYNCETLISADSGATWTKAYQDVTWQPACWNIILNSTTHHVPQLVYGRAKHEQVFLYSGSAWALHSIPIGGVFLNCEALDAYQEYYVYLYDNAGTLTLEASTTASVLQNGVEVMSGATTKLRVGRIEPRERQTGYKAPIMVRDRMLVANLYNCDLKSIGKACPYSADTTGPVTVTLQTSTLFLPIWAPANSDIDCKFICEQGRMLNASTSTGNGAYGLTVLVDGRLPIEEAQTNSDRGAVSLTKSMLAGTHYLELATSAAYSQVLYLCKISTRQYSMVSLVGSVEA